MNFIKNTVIPKNRRRIMQLNLDVDFQQKKTKNKKIGGLLIGAMILIFVMIIVIIFMMMYVQKGAFRVYINEVLVKIPEDIFIIEPDGKVYVSIKDIANYLGYEAHNGEYKLYSEDTNKCYVNCPNETASFFLNSNKISKVPPDQTKDYSDYTIQEPVISRNGKLYCSQEGIQIGFNVSFTYDQENNRIQIYTLPKLLEIYNKIMVGYGYQPIASEDNSSAVDTKTFNNQKAILYNMFVVKKEGGLYGVIDKDNEEIISSKYTNIEFNENAKEFYVTSTTNKVGIVTQKGVTKINLLYDSVQMVDKDNGLYLVKSSNKYGILGSNGETIIHLEYDQIGVDSNSFSNNDIKNKYLLFDNVIPVMQNRKWGLMNKKGKLMVPIEFDHLGYISTESGNANSLLIIPSYKCIVLGKQQDKISRYGIYDYEGNQVIPLALEKVYSVLNAGVNTYYMEHQENTMNIEEYIKKLYERERKTKPTDETTNQVSTNTMNTINS